MTSAICGTNYSTPSGSMDRLPDPWALPTTIKFVRCADVSKLYFDANSPFNFMISSVISAAAYMSFTSSHSLTV